jgi:phosphoglycolate phosphatase
MAGYSASHETLQSAEPGIDRTNALDPKGKSAFSCRRFGGYLTLSKLTVTERLESLSGIIFDLDGVLFEGTNRGYFDCHRRALASVGVEVSPEEHWQRLLQYWSHPHEFQLSLFINNDRTLSQACRVYEECLFSEEFARRISEIPGAARTIKGLSKSHYTLAAASGMHHKQIPGALASIGIDSDLFAACISAYQLPNNEFQKPHPYMLNTILDKLGIDAEYALYVGDSRTDLQMAKAAGVLAVAVLTGNMSRSDAENEEPDVILDSVSNLPDMIEFRREFA